MATYPKLPSGTWRAQVRRRGRSISETFLECEDDAKRQTLRLKVSPNQAFMAKFDPYEAPRTWKLWMPTSSAPRKGNLCDQAAGRVVQEANRSAGSLKERAGDRQAYARAAVGGGRRRPASNEGFEEAIDVGIR